MSENANLDKVREAIEKSGYLEEQKVINEFEKYGFFAGANFAFEDQDNHSSREVDFIITKYTDFEFGKTGFYFYGYGEVKKKADPLVFFERRPQEKEFLEAYIPVVATQEFFSNIDFRLDIQSILDFKRLHHQPSHEFISTQFCVVDPKKGKAEHKNLYESLFVPLLKCIVSEMQSITWSKPFDPAKPAYFLRVFQPILVISGPLLSYNVYTDEIVEKDYILYRRHYRSDTVRKTLLIDVVSKDHLSSYISEKLIQTYKAIEKNMADKINDIFDYCYKDREILDTKVKNITRE